MRFKVEHYSDGLLCVVDTNTQHVVRYHDSVGWETTFKVEDRHEVEALADRMNAQVKAGAKFTLADYGSVGR